MQKIHHRLGLLPETLRGCSLCYVASSTIRERGRQHAGANVMATYNWSSFIWLSLPWSWTTTTWSVGSFNCITKVYFRIQIQLYTTSVKKAAQLLCYLMLDAPSSSQSCWRRRSNRIGVVLLFQSAVIWYRLDFGSFTPAGAIIIFLSNLLHCT